MEHQFCKLGQVWSLPQKFIFFMSSGIFIPGTTTLNAHSIIFVYRVQNGFLCLCMGINVSEYCLCDIVEDHQKNIGSVVNWRFFLGTIFIGSSISKMISCFTLIFIPFYLSGYWLLSWFRWPLIFFYDCWFMTCY